MPITCAEMEKALRDSIELRWKPLAKGVSYREVSACHLCIACDNHVGNNKCKACPLYLVGEMCLTSSMLHINPHSLWGKFSFSENKRKHAQAMLDKLIELHNFYFPEGWDKE